MHKSEHPPTPSPATPRGALWPAPLRAFLRLQLDAMVVLRAMQVDTFFDSYVSGLQNEAQDAVADQNPFGNGVAQPTLPHRAQTWPMLHHKLLHARSS